MHVQQLLQVLQTVARNRVRALTAVAHVLEDVELSAEAHHADADARLGGSLVCGALQRANEVCVRWDAAP